MEVQRTSIFFVLCFMLSVCALEQFEEPYVVFAEETEVLDLVLEVGDTLDTHTECISRVLLAVDAAELEHVGVYHAATEDLDPSCVLAEGATLAATDVTADVHLGAWLGEWEV